MGFPFTINSSINPQLPISSTIESTTNRSAAKGADLQPNISKQCVMYLSSPQAPKGNEPSHLQVGRSGFSPKPLDDMNHEILNWFIIIIGILILAYYNPHIIG